MTDSIKHDSAAWDRQVDGQSERTRPARHGEPLEFGRSLEEKPGDQVAAGSHIVDLYGDRRRKRGRPIDRYTATFAGTRAVKP